MTFIVRQRSATEVPEFRSPIKLLWTDPPFGTGKTQRRTTHQYSDKYMNIPIVHEALRNWANAMDKDGVICVCLDFRNVHLVVSTLLEYGWCLRGEIIWEFGLGRPRTSWWPVRHNTIVTFTRTEDSGLFKPQEVPRDARRARKKGYEGSKPAGSVWWYTMSNTDPERVGYPNQKPLHIIEPFIRCHTNKDDLVVDPFMGSGSTGVAALKLGRKFYGSDINPEAITIAKERLSGWGKV